LEFCIDEIKIEFLLNELLKEILLKFPADMNKNEMIAIQVKMECDLIVLERKNFLLRRLLILYDMEVFEGFFFGGS
jgi:hypothetical protein